MAPATILLIDRDPDSLAIYTSILRHHGYQVLQAHEAESGLRLAFEARPDVVVSELFLPPYSHGEVVERLRLDRRTADTPLVVLDSIPSMARDRLAGWDDLSRLTKPCKPSRLLREIERILDRSLV